MDMNLPAVAPPAVRDNAPVQFSAYGPGWGYCAFEIQPSVMCARLGAADATAKQMLLAFELGKRTIARVITDKSLPSTGERVTLGSNDF